MKEFNIVLTGVGGQGILTLGRIISESALKQGFDVRTTELHGLAQRYGSIPCHIRFGKKMYTPLVLEGEAHLILAMEPLEALRASYYGSKKHKTVFLVNNYPVPPMTVSVLGEKYPSIKQIIKQIKPFAGKILTFDATDIVKKETGRIVMTNVYILGYAISKKLIPLKKKHVLEGIEEIVPKKYVEANKKIFELGMKHKIKRKRI